MIRKQLAFLSNNNNNNNNIYIYIYSNKIGSYKNENIKTATNYKSAAIAGWVLAIITLLGGGAIAAYIFWWKKR